jgi:hypothetical protein
MRGVLWSALILGVWCCHASGTEIKAQATNLVTSGLKGTAAARETHWALQPVQRSTIPAVPDSGWKARNSIDRFVLAKLAESKLSPSPEADRRVLIRRLYFDLVGLPPTPQQVTAFEQDASNDAYEKLVERLLALPQYGERWASHWLDVVRFAETQGFEMNNPRPNAWPYRDYVIRCFNEDRPYNRFILEQIAGDVFGEDAATGFLVAGPWDQVKSPDPVLTATQRADELHDIVSTTSSAFLGLTVGCARCHDHKFDPIPQREYYSLKACLEGVQHGERPLRSPEIAARQQQAEQAKRDLTDLDFKLAAFEPLAHPGSSTSNTVLRAPVNARRNVERFAPVAAKFVRVIISGTTDAEPCIDELEVYTTDARHGNVALATKGTVARASSVYPNSDIHRLEHLIDGKEGNSRSWISNERGGGWVELEFPTVLNIERVVWGRDREQKFRDRLAIDYRIEVATSTNSWQVVASSADRQAYDPNRPFSTESTLTRLPPDEARQAKELFTKKTELEARLQELRSAPMVYAGTFVGQPPATHRLNRGDPMQETEVVAPGALGSIPVRFPLDGESKGAERSKILGADALGVTHSLTTDQSRRLALAQWIIDPANPLPSRVLVNRLWLYHFGEGLVSTPSDFGRNGARPSHPELLDWLAAELVTLTVKSGGGSSPQAWSLKHLQRLMVTSATYRQSSQARADCRGVDAATRLLWRFPPRRLEAEPLRDAILVVSGNLEDRPGGAGFSAFEPNDNYVRVYNPKQVFGPGDWRRMIYMTKVRMQQDGTFGAFDCPDGGQIAPKRMRSITPLQALNLLNSKFIEQQAEVFAKRLHREAGKAIGDQVRLAFQLLFSRLPDTTEAAAAAQLTAQHGLPLLCRTLFNSNEFVFLE